VASHWTLQRDDEGRPLAIFETNNEITDYKSSEEVLRARVRKQTALADLSRSALAGLDAEVLMETATTLVARALERNTARSWSSSPMA